MYRSGVPAEIPKLLNSCKGHIREIVECALNTGMRRGEILSLKWSQIRDGFIYIQKTKTNHARQIPINDDLQTLFERIRAKKEKPKKKNVISLDGKPIDNRPGKSEYVFNYHGRQVSEVKRLGGSVLHRWVGRPFIGGDISDFTISGIPLQAIWL